MDLQCKGEICYSTPIFTAPDDLLERFEWDTATISPSKVDPGFQFVVVSKRKAPASSPSTWSTQNVSASSPSTRTTLMHPPSTPARNTVSRRPSTTAKKAKRTETKTASKAKEVPGGASEKFRPLYADETESDFSPDHSSSLPVHQTSSDVDFPDSIVSMVNGMSSALLIPRIVLTHP